ncbi:MAG: universal stress protein [Gemmatimonadaceae bacterium]
MPATRRTHRRSKTKPIRRPLGAAPVVAPREGPPRRVLIATDGSRQATAALRFARTMADAGAWAPEILTVCEPMPIAVGDVMLPAPPAQIEIAHADSLTATIRRQLSRYGAASWNLVVEFGGAAPEIVRAARARKAGLIVMGLSRHRTLARLFGAETAARVARHSDVPALAVHPGDRWGARPKVVVVALDFGESSMRAAREALALLQRPGRLHLVHVKWSYNVTAFADSEWERAYAAGAEHEFARVRDELGEHPGIEITTELLTGSVIEKVLQAAKSVKADLIALGSHKQNVLDRLMVGSTPSQILRAAPCSVLVAPPPDATP